MIAEQCPITQGEEDLGLILDALPEHLRDALLADGRLHGLVEIVLDLGRPLMARFSGPGLPRVAEIAGRGGEGDNVVSEHDLDHFSNSITRFDSENRHAPHTPHTRTTAHDTHDTTRHDTHTQGGHLEDAAPNLAAAE